MEAFHTYEISNFTFQDGTVTPSIRVAYLDLNPESTEVALVITCFRGKLDKTTTFSSGALSDHRIIVVALLGNGESSSPSNTPGFPRSIDYQDCVRAQHDLLVNHLNLTTIDVVLGFSMGGQCAYYWTLMFPDLVKNAVVICSSARTSGHNYQFLEGPKAALENSADYVPMDTRLPRPTPERGLRAFGKAYSAWLTSAEWFEQEKYRAMGFSALDDWDLATTSTPYYSWHPDDLLIKLRMWQKGNITNIVGCEDDERGGEALKTVLARIRARTLLMPCRTDQYFRWEAAERESLCIPEATLQMIPSIWGHLAGSGINQEDTDWMDSKIRIFLMSNK